MPAFLSLIPLKDWLYGGAIIALLIGFLCFIRHERAIGEAKVIASDQKAVAAQVERDQAVQAVASVATSLAEKTYEKTIAAPVTHAPVPSRLCNNALSHGALPGAPAGNGSGDNPAVSGVPDAGTLAELQRFADNAVTIARDADAQVIALQAVDAALRKEMSNAPGK